MSPRLDRRAAVARLLLNRPEGLLVVSGLGSPSYDLCAAGDDPRNFYLWGAMGGAASLGLGLALARPDKQVMVLTGDGEMLMGLSTFATIAAIDPANLTIVILDNEMYGETGGQQSHTARGVDLESAAAGCGIRDVRTIVDQSGLYGLVERIVAPTVHSAVAVVKIATGEANRVLPSRDGVFLKTRFRAALELESM